MAAASKYDLYSSEFRKHSHEVFAQMRADAPLIKQIGLDGETAIWFVTRYAEAQQVLSDDQHFVRDIRLAFEPAVLAHMLGDQDAQIDRMLNNNMLEREGEDHRRLRSIVSKAFTPKVIQSMRPRVEQIANDLLDRVIEKGQMELVADYAFPLPITVIAELLGVPLDNQDQFRVWSNAFVRPTLTPEEGMEALRMLQAFVGYMQQLVAERRLQPGTDLLSGLIHAEENGDRLNESELFSMLSLLIVAGHETTVSLIGNSVLALLRDPERLRELQNHPDLLPTALEEFLRYDSPVERALARFVAHDVELAGQQLKRGELIIVLLSSANRDEVQFSDPAQLDVQRQQNRHIAFGCGVHYCLGAPLARLEGEIALRTLLQRLPDLTLDIPQESLEWRDVPLFHSLMRLPVTWKTSS